MHQHRLPHLLLLLFKKSTCMDISMHVTSLVRRRLHT